MEEEGERLIEIDRECAGMKFLSPYVYSMSPKVSLFLLQVKKTHDLWEDRRCVPSEKRVHEVIERMLNASGQVYDRVQRLYEVNKVLDLPGDCWDLGEGLGLYYVYGYWEKIAKVIEKNMEEQGERLIELIENGRAYKVFCPREGLLCPHVYLVSSYK